MSSYTFYCHYGGSIVTTAENGIDYEGGRVRNVCIKNGSNLQDLVNKVVAKFQIVQQSCEIKISHRLSKYRSVGDPRFDFYFLQEVEDDDDFEALIQEYEKSDKIQELYVSTVEVDKNHPICASSAGPTYCHPMQSPITVVDSPVQPLDTATEYLVDRTLLCWQDDHISEWVWTNYFERHDALKCRRHERALRGQVSLKDPRVMAYLDRAGFGPIARMSFIQLDQHLISALVERWRPETHTFHMPWGECTITLQDVEVQLGLPVDGTPVYNSTTGCDWSTYCQQQLGNVDPGLKSGTVRLAWLDETFAAQLPPDVDDVVVQRYARAYVLSLIGGVIFPNRTGGSVHLRWLRLFADWDGAGERSWGAACLAYLYQTLCRSCHKGVSDVSGCLILLQVWAWDHMPYLAPLPLPPQELPPLGCPLAARWGVGRDTTQSCFHSLREYRIALDRMGSHQFIYKPYSHVLDELPPFCRAGQAIWRARVPLTCWFAIEWHYPDRVIRQFGGLQRIPHLDLHHSRGHQLIDTRVVQVVADWEAQRHQDLDLWKQRAQHCVPVIPPVAPGFFTDPTYMPWYIEHTRRFLSRDWHLMARMEDFIRLAQRRGDPLLESQGLVLLEELSDAPWLKRVDDRHRDPAGGRGGRGKRGAGAADRAQGGHINLKPDEEIHHHQGVEIEHQEEQVVQQEEVLQQEDVHLEDIPQPVPKLEKDIDVQRADIYFEVIVEESKPQFADSSASRKRPRTADVAPTLGRSDRARYRVA